MFFHQAAMADAGMKKEQAVLEEVSYDDDEVALVAAATEPAVDEKSPAEEGDVASGSGAKSEAQTNGVLVLSLLDKIIGVVDQIQHTQNGLEARQEAMEKSVFSIQGDLAKLSKNHLGTTDTVNKMLEKVRKVSVNVKTVRTNLEKQATQIKKLESNENELLKRRNFKVLLYQVRAGVGWVGSAGWAGGQNVHVLLCFQTFFSYFLHTIPERGVSHSCCGGGGGRSDAEWGSSGAGVGPVC